MLIGLSIRNYTIVPKLDVEFGPGFNALTGETGVGKSVIISALQIALGARAEPSCIATGADSATLTASFVLNCQNHPVLDALAEHSIEADDTSLTMRRVIRTNSSRAFVNDQPVSATTARTIANMLVEIQNQRASCELLTPEGQMNLLDCFANCLHERANCQELWKQHQKTLDHLLALKAEQKIQEADEAFIKDSLAELNALDAQPGEASSLSAQRKTLLHAADNAQTILEVNNLLDNQDPTTNRAGALNALEKAASLLARLQHRSPEITECYQATERAIAETRETLHTLQSASEQIHSAPEYLETVEERLFNITATARKHKSDPDQLHLMRHKLEKKLSLIDNANDLLHNADKQAQIAEKRFANARRKLTTKRTAAAKDLARAVMGELPPMHLQNTRMRVSLKQRDLPGPQGAETVSFEVSTNPDTPFGPLARIASGGEFSRIALALRLCVNSKSVETLVFDEADAGIGGATAAAVGERMARLAKDKQVLAVTHSPQVAAASTTQWRIHKSRRNGRTMADMTLLTDTCRTEEIARMISGAHVTQQARAAAERLLDEA